MHEDDSRPLISRLSAFREKELAVDIQSSVSASSATPANRFIYLILID
jgi:hypothetical protein